MKICVSKDAASTGFAAAGRRRLRIAAGAMALCSASLLASPPAHAACALGTCYTIHQSHPYGIHSAGSGMFALAYWAGTVLGQIFASAVTRPAPQPVKAGLPPKRVAAQDRNQLGPALKRRFENAPPPTRVAYPDGSAASSKRSPGAAEKNRLKNALASSALASDAGNDCTRFFGTNCKTTPPAEERTPNCVDFDGVNGDGANGCAAMQPHKLHGMPPNRFTDEQKDEAVRTREFAEWPAADWTILKSKKDGEALIQKAFELLTQQEQLNGERIAAGSDKQQLIDRRLSGIKGQLSAIKQKAKRVVVQIDGADEDAPPPAAEQNPNGAAGRASGAEDKRQSAIEIESDGKSFKMGERRFRL